MYLSGTTCHSMCTMPSFGVFRWLTTKRVRNRQNESETSSHRGEGAGSQGGVVNRKALSERGVCTKFITPAAAAVRWDIQRKVGEELTFTKGCVPEQRRIVVMVTELFALRDQLKDRIAGGRAKHAQMTEALVARAVN